MDFFTPENIIEPLMGYYKDMNYVNYIMNLSFKDGFKLYLKCVEMIEARNDEKVKDRIYNLWLVEIQNGYGGTFEEYYKSLQHKNIDRNLNKDIRDSEEKRIIDEITNKNIKLKERVFNI